MTKDKQKGMVLRFTLLPMLAVLFIGLKLTGYIAWSWWWVTAPIWGPLAGVFFFVLLIFGFALLATAITGGIVLAIAMFEAYEETRNKNRRVVK